jgi:hypothetical protein
MRVIQLIAIAFALIFTFPAQSAERRGEAIAFDVPVLPDVARHVAMLEYPAYLALALENVGLSPSLSSPLVVRNAATFEIRNAAVQFKSRKNSAYEYQAALKIPVGLGETSLTVRVEIDASQLQAGKLVVLVFPPMSSLLPQELLDRAEIKIHTLASPDAQRRALAYLDRVRKRGEARMAGEGGFDAILTDAYNRIASMPAVTQGGREPGDAEPVSEQIFLIISVAIWAVCLPLSLFGRFWAIRRAARREPEQASHTRV